MKNGYIVEIPEIPTPDEKKLIQLDAQAKDVICSYLTKSQFIRFRRFDSAKEIWETLRRFMNILKLREMLTLKCFKPCSIIFEVSEMKVLWKLLIV